MNCELEYQAWMLLDQIGSQPEIEDRKRRIVERTLQRIERATREHRREYRCVIDLTGLLGGASLAVETAETPSSAVKFS